MSPEQLVTAAHWRGLGLRTLTANQLAREGICSVEQLNKRDEWWLMRMPNVGKVAIRDMMRLGLFRGPDGTPWWPDAAPTLDRIPDSALVMELLRRGYRVDRPA